ncbi:MAG: hypothetical protein ACRD15_00110 [Vicinamibacterales bacterium]
MTHLTDDDLVLQYYGELPAPQKAEAAAHLESCHRCRADYSRLQRELGTLDERVLSQATDPPPSFERTVWARLEPHLRREHRGRLDWMRWSRAPLALAASVLILVAGAFFAGRALSPNPPATPVDTATISGAQIRERILLVDLGEHLDRSQMVLVELVSSEGEGSVDISGERARAEELIASNRLYRQTAEDTGDIAISQLLDEIERVLTEVAASPERVSPQDLAAVQRRIESRDLLFKLRVVSSEVRERQKEAFQLRAVPGPRS